MSPAGKKQHAQWKITCNFIIIGDKNDWIGFAKYIRIEKGSWVIFESQTVQSLIDRSLFNQQSFVIFLAEYGKAFFQGVNEQKYWLYGLYTKPMILETSSKPS